MPGCTAWPGSSGPANPDLRIHNPAEDGATLADMVARLAGGAGRGGLHPSDAGCRVWFTELQRQVNLPRWLGGAG